MKPIPRVPSALELLRQAAAMPHHGKPARYEIQFQTLALERKHGRDEFWYWWEYEMKPVVKNLTGDRAIVGSYLASVFVDTASEAEAIAIMFRGQIVGVLDWDEIKWILLPSRSENADLF